MHASRGVNIGQAKLGEMRNVGKHNSFHLA